MARALRDACMSRLRYACVTAFTKYGISVHIFYNHRETSESVTREFCH